MNSRYSFWQRVVLNYGNGSKSLLYFKGKLNEAL